MSRLHKEKRKLLTVGLTRPNRGQDSCLNLPLHTHTSRHLRSRTQGFFALCIVLAKKFV